MGKSILLRWVTASILLINSSLVMAETIVVADLEAGKVRSVICVGCHGMSGEGKEAANGQPPFPRLAGQIQGYLAKAVMDYKNDRRTDPMMQAIAKGLSDADIINLAAFYASQQ